MLFELAGGAETGIALSARDYPDGMNNAWDIAQQCQEDIEPKMHANTHLKENPQWG
jgi:hypothetical protein